MSQQTTTANAIVLTNASQWHNWISIVKANAKQAKIWDLIDPSQETEPPHAEPTLPKKSDIIGDNELTRSDTYADLMAQFNIDYKKYQENTRPSYTHWQPYKSPSRQTISHTSSTRTLLGKLFELYNKQSNLFPPTDS